MKQKLLTILIIICIGVAVVSTKVDAATLGLSASRSNVNVGESVTITVSGSGLTGRVNLSASGGSLSSSSVWVEGNSQSVTLNTSGPGTITVRASGTLSDDEGNESSYNRSCTISVTEKQQENTTSKSTATKKQVPVQTKISTNTVVEEEPKPQLGIYYLAINSINNNDEKAEITLDKAFDLNIFEYLCNVSSDIKKIEIQADAKDYNDSVTIEGADKELVSGENIITLTVTDGEKSVKYVIKVIKAEPEENKSEEPATPKKKITDKTITIPVIYFALMQAGIIAVEIGGYYGVKKIIKKIKNK